MNGLERPRAGTREAWLRRASTPAAALGALALLSCAPSGGSPAAPAPTPPTVGDTRGAARTLAGKAPDETASLADLPEAVAQLERLRESVDRICAADPAEKKAIAELDAALLRFTSLRGRLERLPVDDLSEIHRIMATSDAWASSKDEVVTTRLRRIERRLARVAELKGTFGGLSALAEEESAPPGIRRRAGGALALLDELGRRLVTRRTEVLVSVDKLAEVRGNAAALLAEAEGHLEEAQETADQLSREPIWSLRLAGWSGFDGAAKRLHRDARRVLSFTQENAARFLVVSLLVFCATAAFLFRLGRRAPGRDGTDPPPAASQLIQEISWVAAVPLAVALIVLATPPAPPAFYSLALLPAAPAAAWIVVKVLGPGIARTVWVLAASVAILPLRGALEFFPLVGRLVFLLQTLPLAAVLAFDFRKERWNDLIPDVRFARALQKVAWTLAAILGAAAAGTMGGWLRLSNWLGLGALETLAEHGVRTPIVRLGWPDRFVGHATDVKTLRAAHGLSPDQMLAAVKAALR